MATWASLSVALDSIIKLCKVSSFLSEKEQNPLSVLISPDGLLAYLVSGLIASFASGQFTTLWNASKTHFKNSVSWLIGLLRSNKKWRWCVLGIWVMGALRLSWSMAFGVFCICCIVFSELYCFFVCCANDIISWDPMSFLELLWLSCCDWHQLLLLWLSENLFLPI